MAAKDQLVYVGIIFLQGLNFAKTHNASQPKIIELLKRCRNRRDARSSMPIRRLARTAIRTEDLDKLPKLSVVAVQ